MPGRPALVPFGYPKTPKNVGRRENRVVVEGKRRENTEISELIAIEKENYMLKAFLTAIVIASTTATVAFAEPAEVKPMADPQMGDHWTYAQRDEITGDAKPTFTQTLTEVRGDELSVRVMVAGRQNAFVVYDREWNAKENLVSQFSPHDGAGVKMPLAVGQTWTVDVKRTTMKGAPVWSGSRTARVVGQSTLTTKAGRFDTFEIESTTRTENSNSSESLTENALRTWYAPAINHWVKRIRETRINGRLMTKDAEELVEYGRREGD